MKKSLILIVSALLIAVFALPSLAAGVRRQAPAASTANCPVANISPIVIEGTVKADSPANGAILIDAEGKEYELRFGPAWYKTVDLKEGQELKVEGIISPRFNTTPVRFVVFNYSVQGGEKVVLRENVGSPLWAGQGKGQGKGQGRGFCGANGCPVVNN